MKVAYADIKQENRSYRAFTGMGLVWNVLEVKTYLQHVLLGERNRKGRNYRRFTDAARLSSSAANKQH